MIQKKRISSAATSSLAFVSQLYHVLLWRGNSFATLACWHNTRTTSAFQRQNQPQRQRQQLRLYHHSNIQSYNFRRGFGVNQILSPSTYTYSDCNVNRFGRQQVREQTRLFGYKVGSGIVGEVTIQDEQSALPNINIQKLRETAIEIRKYIASTSSKGLVRNTACSDYESYDVAIYLIDDENMRDANKESRKIDAPTDILSYPFHDAIEPGILEEPLIDVPDYYNLGDILIDVPYIIRSCKADELEAQGETEEGANDDDVSEEEEEEDDDDEYEEERGISGAMANVYDPEIRINMLLIHGMLHLVGYDHEDDDDYELMVSKEEEILHKLQALGVIKIPQNQL